MKAWGVRKLMFQGVRWRNLGRFDGLWSWQFRKWVELGFYGGFRWCWGDSGMILGWEWVEKDAGCWVKFGVDCWKLVEVLGWIWDRFDGVGRSGFRGIKEEGSC